MEAMPRQYLSEEPTHTTMTLQYLHTFHAMAPINHWARNRTVLCPVCRARPVNPSLVMGRLPKEWLYSMAARAWQEQKQDRVDEEQHDHQAAVQVAALLQQLDVIIEV